MKKIHYIRVGQWDEEYTLMVLDQKLDPNEMVKRLKELSGPYNEALLRYKKNLADLKEVEHYYSDEDLMRILGLQRKNRGGKFPPGINPAKDCPEQWAQRIEADAHNKMVDEKLRDKKRGILAACLERMRPEKERIHEEHKFMAELFWKSSEYGFGGGDEFPKDAPTEYAIYSSRFVEEYP